MLTLRAEGFKVDGMDTFTYHDYLVFESLQEAEMTANEEGAGPADVAREQACRKAWQRILRERGANDAPEHFYNRFYGEE